MSRWNLVFLCVASLPGNGFASEDGPVCRFARGGDRLEISAECGEDSQAVLRAFGRNWGDPIKCQDGRFTVTAPTPRVAVTFELVLIGPSDSRLATIVVYPPTPKTWDKQYPLLVDRRAPDWLKEWLRATRMPAEEVDLGTADGSLAPTSSTRGVLLVGRKAAGATVKQFVERQSRWQMNAIVFDAEWMTSADASSHISSGFRAAHGLRSLEDWRPLSRLPTVTATNHWMKVGNRRSWFSSSNATWIEEIFPGGSDVALLTSGVDWPRWLGSEPVDVLFHEMLWSCASNAVNKPSLDRAVEVWPPDRLETSRVLRAAANADNARRAARHKQTTVYVLDVRGPELSSAAKRSLPLKRLSSESEFWIVLGDDQAFSPSDREAFRQRSAKSAPRFCWIEDDRRPKSVSAEIPLMHVLTEFGVRLAANAERSQ